MVVMNLHQTQLDLLLKNLVHPCIMLILITWVIGEIYYYIDVLNMSEKIVISCVIIYGYQWSLDGTGNNSDVWTTSATAQLQSPTTYTAYTNPPNSLLTTSPNMTPNNFPPTNTMLTPENLVRINNLFLVTYKGWSLH